MRRQLASTAPTTPETAVENAAQSGSISTALPQRLRGGLERLSGLDLAAVRVRYNSARPARLGALAYTKGSEIYLGPGQERHLPHEGWHVVQQRQGRVAATVQAMESPTGATAAVGLNDDDALEREADAMGAKALRLASSHRTDATRSPGLDESPLARPHPGHQTGGVVQRVKGGLEYTEDTPTMLWAYNHKPFPANVLRHGNTFQVGVSPMSGFRLGVGRDPLPNADLGNWTNEDLDVLRSTAHVKLTNDVRSAEWIIERHQQDLAVDEFRRTIKADVDDMFAARAALAEGVTSLRSGHAGEVGVAFGTKADTNAAPQVFIYSPGPLRGKVQITAKYTREDTIQRINKLNASKYLTGSKVAEGEDIPRVSGTESQALQNADIAGTTSFSTADVLLNALVGTSNAIPLTAGGGNRLTANQVGLVKLMVINDALATTMVRYQDVVGQGQEKNIQRFFPKSRRNEYVKTIAQAALDGPESAALYAEIRRTSAADAQLVFASADPGALRTDEAFAELMAAGTDVSAMVTAKRGQIQAPLAVGAVMSADLIAIKTAVLGANGANLQTNMDFVALAYTETAGGAEQHYFHDPGKANQSPNDIANYGIGGGGEVTNVIVTSRGYTDLHGDTGAVYEMREREVGIDKSGFFNIGSHQDLNNAIDRLFGAAG
jgi:hypothetical protein